MRRIWLILGNLASPRTVPSTAATAHVLSIPTRTTKDLQERWQTVEDLLTAAEGGDGSSKPPWVRVLGHYWNLKPETKRVRDLVKRARTAHVEREPRAPRPHGVSRLTASQNARIADLYQAGWKPVDIARELGTTEWTVHHRLNRLGVVRRPTGLTPEQCREAVRLYQDGESLRQIGLKLGFNDKTVKKAIVEAGLASRESPRHSRSTPGH